jgi:hypothetical protein
MSYASRVVPNTSKLVLFRALNLLVVLAAVGCAPIATRYDTVFQKATHNSYARNESLFDQLVYHRVRSLEIDVWINQGFKVDHNGGGENDTNCTPLQACLAQLVAFHHATPMLEVVTVWLEPTDYQSPQSTPFPRDELDAMIRQLPLFEPSDLLKTSCPGHPSGSFKKIADVAAACGFPTTDQLRGKYIFVVMDANPGEVLGLTNYLGPTDPATRAAFVAPRGAMSGGQSNEGVCDGCAVFYNPASEGLNSAYGSGVSNERLCCSDPGDGCSAKSSPGWTRMIQTDHIQHVGTNCVNYVTSPWAVTQNAHGWPFTCPAGTSCADAVEANDLIPLLAVSGDLDGTSDDFVYAFAAAPQAPTWNLTAFVSSPSSGANPWAKGCLMARQSASPSSSYFAICRPDQNPLRIQYRTRSGADTSVGASSISPQKAGASWLRLNAARRAEQTCFSGETSTDSVNWAAVNGDVVCLDGVFPLQGLTVSSHGSQQEMMLFGNVQSAVNGVVQNLAKANFPTVQWIGTRSPPGRGSILSDPVLPPP